MQAEPFCIILTTGLVLFMLLFVDMSPRKVMTERAVEVQRVQFVLYVTIPLMTACSPTRTHGLVLG